ncbi:G [Blacklegged tick rhabdovirus 1]|uniref:G n=1 Tax=Blacklegged tick rhabdovirus 1 TaxID=2079605 RepID=A0A2K9YNG4_9RHAB|nr:G [Blacklegged tick rhabdovirus-1] [Blacklegged tick rhabdovirus-1]AUW34389.1 G [Blacklegged tick rhabdovirus-1] [Blacklegged tick rhabdovirus-1]
MRTIQNRRVLLVAWLLISPSLGAIWISEGGDSSSPGSIKAGQPSTGHHKKISTKGLKIEGPINKTHSLIRLPYANRWFIIPSQLLKSQIPEAVNLISTRLSTEVRNPSLPLITTSQGHILPSLPNLNFFPLTENFTSKPTLAPPLNCETENSSSLMPGVLRIWGPPSSSKTVEGRLVSCYTKLENCTKYFFGSEQISTLYDRKTECNSYHLQVMDENIPQIWNSIQWTHPNVQAPCLWTGTQSVREDYIHSEKVNVILSSDGFVSFPLGMSFCPAFQQTSCKSKSQVLFLKSLIKDPSGCDSLEIKMISKVFISLRQFNKTNFIMSSIKDPNHQLGFSLENAKQICHKDGKQFFHSLLLTKSLYILSLLPLDKKENGTLGLESLSTWVRDLQEDEDYWKSHHPENNTETSDPKDQTASAHQWRIHHKIPIRTVFTEAEIIYGLNQLSDLTEKAIQQVYLEVCKLTRTIWQLAVQTWKTNPTFVAQLISKSNNVIGENRNGTLLIHHSVPAGPLELKLPLEFRGNWVKASMMNPFSRNAQVVWIQRISGFIVNHTPRATPSTMPPPDFLIPFNQTHYFNILDGSPLVSELITGFMWNSSSAFFSSSLTLERQDTNALEQISKILDEVAQPPSQETVPVPDRGRGIDISHHWQDFVTWITSLFSSWKLYFALILITLCVLIIRCIYSKFRTSRVIPLEPSSPLSFHSWVSHEPSTQLSSPV